MKFKNKKLEAKLNKYGFADIYNNYVNYINDANFTDEQRKKNKKKLNKCFEHLISAIKSQKFTTRKLSKITVANKFLLEKLAVSNKSKIIETLFISDITWVNPEDAFPVSIEHLKEAE